jgi:ubiquitin C-terminal hydrolase
MGSEDAIPARRHASVDVNQVLSSPVQEEEKPRASRHVRSKSLTLGQKLGFRMRKSSSKDQGTGDVETWKSKDVFQAIKGLEILDPDVVGPEVGIVNEGNTCFLAALLQCVLATPGLVEAIMKKDVPCSSGEEGEGQCVLVALKKVIEQLYTKSTDTASVKITELMNALKQIPLAAEYLNNQQQDIQEVLLLILDVLDSELSERETKVEEDGTTVISQWNVKTSSSLIAETFLGQMKSSVVCEKCQKCFTMDEPFLELSLSIAPSTSNKGLLSWLGFNSLSLRDSLFEYTSGDVLDGDELFSCAYCDCKTKATKQLGIHTLPRALILHLKRFKYTSRLTTEKIDKLVTFPLKGLDLRHHLSKESQHRPEECIYDLYAVAEHKGNLTTGHYTALVLKKDGNKLKWVHCNDELIKSVSNDQYVVSPNAYLLFYIRRHFADETAAAEAYANLDKVERR